MITPVSDLTQIAERLGWYHLLMVEEFWWLLTLRFTETRLRAQGQRTARWPLPCHF